MRKDSLYEELTEKITEILSRNLTPNCRLKAICKLLRNSVSHYDWVGFYFVEKQKPCELVLGPFEGEPTEHVRIPFGKGICGQAASRKKTLVVQDVSKELNYLSCSPKVKSEIVTPIFIKDRIVGELDVDSHAASAFTKGDEAFLEKIAKLVSGFLASDTSA